MQKTDNRPIGVFDSGVGGLSILIELKKLLPNENFVFLADQKYVPYGEKTKSELVKLCTNITDYFVKKHDIKMMVVACNTATCGSIEELRATYSFPIVGTVPAVKPASVLTKSGTVAVISTPSTSQSLALNNIINHECGDVKVINVGCKNLENAVETGDLFSDNVKTLLNTYLKEIINSNTDHLVLGCTHYPFLKKTIQKMVGRKIKLIDSGRAIAKNTKSLAVKHKIANKQKMKGKTKYFTTGGAKKFSKVASSLLKTKVVANSVKL
ncbi:MAG: glutamate racemase [Candidatus Pacebacteria bacterium]|nr:glutamate racemase [Candidatus Paceibacterota bacterium]